MYCDLLEVTEFRPEALHQCRPALSSGKGAPLSTRCRIRSFSGFKHGNEGAKLEDQYLVTKNGLDKLSSLPLDLI